mmetsp:Transcript_28291/g.32541  ORF Transcript_28291/g.32541 Transcript_28291/m.32541 type:complete len:394 (+) Transcript_28291:144-1325(+)
MPNKLEDGSEIKEASMHQREKGSSSPAQINACTTSNDQIPQKTRKMHNSLKEVRFHKHIARSLVQGYQNDDIVEALHLTTLEIPLDHKLKEKEKHRYSYVSKKSDLMSSELNSLYKTKGGNRHQSKWAPTLHNIEMPTSDMLRATDYKRGSVSHLNSTSCTQLTSNHDKKNISETDGRVSFRMFISVIVLSNILVVLTMWLFMYKTDTFRSNPIEDEYYVIDNGVSKGNSTLHDPSPDINLFCSSNSSSVWVPTELSNFAMRECAEICSKGLCCMPDDVKHIIKNSNDAMTSRKSKFISALDESCYIGNEDICSTYIKHCSKVSLYENKLREPPPIPTDLLSEFCSDLFIDNYGEEECVESCDIAVCCFDGTCEVQSIDVCTLYEPCARFLKV